MVADVEPVLSSYDCTCNTGWTGDGTSCIECFHDECLRGSSNSALGAGAASIRAERLVQSFDSTAHVHTFPIPVGVYTITAYVWGSGGRGARVCSWGAGAGGAGAFIKVSIDVRTMDSLKLVTGQYGEKGGGLSGIFYDDNAFGFTVSGDTGYVTESSRPLVVAAAGPLGDILVLWVKLCICYNCSLQWVFGRWGWTGRRG